MTSSKTIESKLTVLNPAADHLTIINTYVVSPERADELLDFLTRSTTETVRHVPGFISANFHVNMDRTQVVNYSQWKNQEALIAARANPVLADLMRQQGEIATSFAPIMYKLKSSFEAASRQE